MRGAIILLSFFLLFTSASLLIPSQMFPGNFLCIIIGKSVNQYAPYLSAVFNGAFYSAILWLVFTVISRRLEQEK